MTTEVEHFKELFRIQGELGKKITNLYSLFKKEGKRLGKLERLTYYREQLDAEWTQFLNNNNELNENSEQLKDEPYFLEQYFTYIELFYKEMRTTIDLKDRLVRIKNKLPIAINEEAGEAQNNADTNENEVLDEPSDVAMGGVDSDHKETSGEESEPEDNDGKTENGEQSFQFPKRQVFFTPGVSPERNIKENESIKKFSAAAQNVNALLDNIEDTLADGCRALAQIALEDSENKWAHLKDMFYEASLVDYGNKTEHGNVFRQLRNRYYLLTEQLKQHQDKKNGQRTETTASAVKIDAIKIPKYYGEYEEWPSFSSLFSTLIIDNDKINELEKIQYLKSIVGGKAAGAIARIEISEGNFIKAWSILNSRFNNKQAIKESKMRALFALESVNGESATKLRELHDKGKEHAALLDDITVDEIIIHIIKHKMDEISRDKYEEQKGECETLDEFFSFLHKRCRVLESKNIETTTRKSNDFKKDTKKTQFNFMCPCCGEKHKIYFCEKFKAMKPMERSQLAKNKNLCVLCLRAGHLSAQCSYTKMCPQCNKKHNGLLHFGNESDRKSTDPKKPFETKTIKKSFVAVTEEIKDEQQIAACATSTNNKDEVLLATAMIRIKTQNGWSEPIRALIDQGSTGTFCTEKLVQDLGLTRRKNRCDVWGVGETVSEQSKGSVNIEFTARYPTSFSAKTTAIIMNKVMKSIPLEDANEHILQGTQLEHLILADVEFWKKSKIDLVLGADVFYDIILFGVDKSHPNGLLAQETELGWMISGHTNKTKAERRNLVCMLASVEQFKEDMKKFIENEDLNESIAQTSDDEYCVQHFNETVQRDESGKYILALPFKRETVPVGDTRRSAVAQLLQLERKFEKVPQLKEEYTKFMREYIEMGHMRLCSEAETREKPACYSPHHAVYKEDSTTTKMRAVYNASQKTNTGFSLNDSLLVGPRLQDDLSDIMMRFRTHRIGFCADVSKMYRQILIRECDQTYQRILWRENPNEPIREYKLTTVTYGTSPAPFMAVKTVLHHAESESINYPEACEKIKQDMYMDDVSSGADNLQEAVKLQREITHVLALAGLPLRKWISNSKKLLEQIPESERDGAPIEFGSEENSVSTLGLLWYHENDKLGFKVKMDMMSNKMTKRSILSDISKIYDPLGLLAPVTIYNKILMQEIWSLNIDWDKEVSDEIATKWSKMKDQMQLLSDVRINRWIGSDAQTPIELIGFSDASTKAYAAVIYTCVCINGKKYVQLLTSKTRVAPMKTVTLPRLELCAAVLLAKLMRTVKKALKTNIEKTTFYSDSEVTLAWIRAAPTRWKAYVANRVHEIHRLSHPNDWKYVNTKENSADCASRGLLPEALMEHKLWWNGPDFLRDNKPHEEMKIFSTDEELEPQVKMIMAVTTEPKDDIFSRFSTMNRAVRVVAWCKRILKENKKAKSL